MKKIIALLFILALIICLVLFNVRPRPNQLTDYLYASQNGVSTGKLKVQFLGNTNLLFTDGETSILTDGFFSRPSAVKVLFGKVEPNASIIQECLKRANIDKLDAVIPLHSHFDHALDAPMVADLSEARLIGSESTANIGRGYGLTEDQIEIPKLGETIKIGRFEVTFIKSQHWQYPDPEQRERLLNNTIDTPLETPASIYDYKEGDSYTLLIKHDSTKIAIQGSAGYLENSIANFDADILFLAVAGLDVMDEEYNQGYQDHLILPLMPEVLVPIHWDDFTVKLSERPLSTPSLLFNLKFGSDLTLAFEEIEKRNAERDIKVLPIFKEIPIEALIK